jgi:hypothetical protein
MSVGDAEPAPAKFDPELAATLPRSAWNVILSHLGGGAYREVAEVVLQLMAQLTPQEEAAIATQTAIAAPDSDSIKRAH